MSLLIIQVIIIIIHKDASEREEAAGRRDKCETVQSLINSFFINVRLERRINIH